MIRFFLMTSALVGLSACGDGNPFFESEETSADDTPGNVYLENTSGTIIVNDISYDPVADQVIINNIPFDDPNNRYDRVTTETFANDFDAYESNPAPGSTEFDYYAIFKRTTHAQVAATGTAEYVTFGFGGGGAQRLTAAPTLPSTGIYSYTGEYAAVRTTINSGAPNDIEYITGDARLTVDIDDFDTTGAATGIVNNRQAYDTTGAPTGAVTGFISLAVTDIDFSNATTEVGTATHIDGGVTIGTGNWQGVLAGPNGEELAGVLFVAGDPSVGGAIQEIGGFTTNQ